MDERKEKPSSDAETLDPPSEAHTAPPAERDDTDLVQRHLDTKEPLPPGRYYIKRTLFVR